MHVPNTVEIHWTDVRSADLLSVGELPRIPLLQLQLLKLQGSGDLARLLSRLSLPSLKILHIQTSSAKRDHRLLEDFLNKSSYPLQQFILWDNLILDLESAVKYLTIPFLGSILDIEVHIRSLVPMTAFQELKDSHTPTLDCLKIAYPYNENLPVFNSQYNQRFVNCMYGAVQFRIKSSRPPLSPMDNDVWQSQNNQTKLVEPWSPWRFQNSSSNDV
ncbi:hypothetical protein K443DRAFT_7074 [Laccaria amethystina LaAM-08-1]|uniref:Uncharacterized protein n=1 Tax=Laccaria amethystina LaAM-08-1 TaxID=1095629 RepID=A0A0C9X828_9AGAR|nr:hypothetical protein K443DRAFT_7074 [Laccaria amethystina LaAM-08-1]